MQARLTLHLEATGVDEHHVAEAAFKALGRALRVAVSAGDSGSTKGAIVKVVLADYGAGNLRSCAPPSSGPARSRS